MATPVIVPKIEMAQEYATVVEWLKQDGDSVDRGEPLVEVETNKVTMAVESPASGVLVGIEASPGDEVPVTEVIAYIVEEGEVAPDDVEPAINENEAKKATPVARHIAQERGVDLHQIEGTGRQGKIRKADVERVLEAEMEAAEVRGSTSEPRTQSLSHRVRATPAARRIARSKNVELADLVGSGPRGRVQSKDVRAFAAKHKEPSSVAADIVPLDGMRRTIAERLTQSYRTVPHIDLTVRVNMRAFQEARARINEALTSRDKGHVSVTAFIVKAVAWALKSNPWLNSTLSDKGIHLLEGIHIGVAVALQPGLVVPVVQDADHKSLTAIASELGTLVTRAQDGQLRSSDLAGGTFTVTNLGAMGIGHFKAIINPPEAAILAVGAIESAFIPDKDGKPVMCPVMHMTLSADHRIVDGATAARFLSDLVLALEQPVLLL